MADQKISQLTELTSATTDDLLPIVDDPAGSPVLKRITVGNFASLIAPAGVIMQYGGSTAPSGYLLCDGASYLRADYASLFTAIGTTFGSADGTHFNVPDMQGVYAKGAGTTSRTAGKDANGNYYAATLGTYLTDKMQGHKHAPTGGSPLNSTTGTAWTYQAASGPTNIYYQAAQPPNADGTNGTPRTGLTTEPQNLGLTYIIKT